MAGVRGLKVWISTRPASAPRPARPATCVRSWKVRSAARKSGSASAVSASTTPTRVTPGKSCPFVTICVPTSTSSSRRAKRASTAAVSSALASRVAVEPRDPRAAGSSAAHGLLDLLGADAHAEAGRRRRPGSARPSRSRLAAVVAEQQAAPRVVGERDRALGAARLARRTPRRPPASGSRGGSGTGSPAARPRASRRAPSASCGESEPGAGRSRRARRSAREVHELHRRHRPVVDAGRERERAGSGRAGRSRASRARAWPSRGPPRRPRACARTTARSRAW